MDGWNPTFKRPIFKGYISFREGIILVFLQTTTFSRETSHPPTQQTMRPSRINDPYHGRALPIWSPNQTITRGRHGCVGVMRHAWVFWICSFFSWTNFGWFCQGIRLSTTHIAIRIPQFERERHLQMIDFLRYIRHAQSKSYQSKRSTLNLAGSW